MTSQLIQLETELWEAWIEYEQFNSRQFGTLYIIGEILTDQRSAEPVVKKINRSNGDRLLVLQLPHHPPGRSRVKEVLYSEPIEQLNQYTAVYIYAGDQLITRFDEIEVLV